MQNFNHFRQIAQNNLNWLREGKTSLTERVGAPPIRKLPFILSPFVKPRVPWSNPNLRDFFKRHFNDAWEVYPEGVQLNLLNAIRRRYSQWGTELDNIFHGANGLFPPGSNIKIVEVTYYSGGQVLIKDQNGTLYLFGILDDGTVVALPTSLPGPTPNTFPSGTINDFIKPGVKPITPNGTNIVWGEGGQGLGLLAPIFGVPMFSQEDNFGIPYNLPIDTPISPSLPQLPPNMLPIDPYDPVLNQDIYGG
jgi:hypothetical protein